MSVTTSPITANSAYKHVAKKGDTRRCPVCDDDIPVRLLAKHADFELQRVDDIVCGIGSSSIICETDEAGNSTRRGAALKARKSLKAINPRSASELDTHELADKTIRTLKRNRKQRHTRLRELMAQEDDDNEQPAVNGYGTTCPVCLTAVRGDDDVVNAHVDSCLAHANRLQAEAAERDARERAERVEVDAWEEYEADGERRIRLGDATALRGTGFHIRDRNQQDVDDEVDVDGDDEVVFGGAQFTEMDVVDPMALPQQDTGDINIDGDGSGDDDDTTLRDLIAEGRVASREPPPSDSGNNAKVEADDVMDLAYADRLEVAVSQARRNGISSTLIVALENKIRHLESVQASTTPSLLCRICLDPYNEPTTSTGCWHTCCRECWLRCLGSTKLCPICKRITAATDLRRIYM